MTDIPPSAPLTSLGRVLAQRVAGVILVVLVAIAAGSTVVFLLAARASGEVKADDAVDHLRARIVATEERWLADADVVRAQIDFTRLLDAPDDDARRAGLTAWFASLGGHGTFTHAALADQQGRVLFRFRAGSQPELPLPPAGGGAAWVYGEQDRTLYRAVTQRLVMAGAPARLVLYAPLDNGLLSRNVFPNTGIELRWRGAAVARAGELAEPRGVLAGALQGALVTTRELPWDEAAPASGPQLAITRSYPLPMSIGQLLVVVAVASLLAGLFGWLVLGRWLSAQSQRLGTLRAAAGSFGRDGALPPADAGRLAAEQTAGDEIGQLAGGLLQMMRDIEHARDAQQRVEAELLALNAGLEERVATRTQELAAARDAALAAVRAKETFLASMSHELRTPLNGLLGSLELMRARPLPEGQGELLDIAAGSGSALLAIINEVLDYSKIEAGKLELVREEFGPAELAASAVRLFAGSARAKGLALRLQTDPRLPLRVTGDPNRVRQVLLNLIGNAVKFTDQGSIEVRVHGEGGAGGEPLRLRVEVADTGHGIALDEQALIFEPFAQGRATRARAVGGTGLGLAICWRLVAAMGGEIDVRSTPGVGSTFRFSVLLTPVAPPVASSQAPLPAAEQPLHGRVLLVEDNQINRTVGTLMLQSLGLDVVECDNGQRAVELTADERFDLVLMDVLMPVMDGLTATRAIRAREAARGEPHRPIIALTANALSHDVEQCLAAGMDAHLGKPYWREQLYAAIAPFLARPREDSAAPLAPAGSAAG